MKHIGLFEGIGGFSLAARWMGWETIAWCEFNPFCQTVLKYHFKNATPHGDIRNTDFSIYRGKCDILTGGFPCQPFSTAGQRKGTDDDRYLWPEMLRAVREIAPRWILGENVDGIFTWSEGMVFETVCADLENEGYEVQAYRIPACATGAPHRRDRWWFVAHANLCTNRTNKKQDGKEDGLSEINRKKQLRTGQPSGTNFNDAENPLRNGRENVGCKENTALWEQRDISAGNGIGVYYEKDGDASNYPPAGLERNHPKGQRCTGGWNSQHFCSDGSQWDEHWLKAATRLCSVDDGFSGKLDGITFPKWRNESIKAYGNAIVPQVAYQIFQAIEETEMLLKNEK